MYTAITATNLCTIIIVYDISVSYFTTMSNYFMCTVCDRSPKEVGSPKEVRSPKEVSDKVTIFFSPFIYSRTSCDNRAQLATAWSTCTVCGHFSKCTVCGHSHVFYWCVLLLLLYVYCLWLPHVLL